MALESLFTNPWFVVALVVIIVWELAWKGIALWHCAQRKQVAWFVAILLLNTIGILPIIYLLITRKK